MVQIEGNTEIIQALHDVAGESRRVGLDLHHRLYLGPDPAHPSGHDEADVSASDDDHLFSGNIAFNIDQSLGESCRIDPARSGAGGADVSPVPFAAAHG